MANTKKVAKLANVSVATVSRVINNTGKVAPDTRKRVEDAIKELDYVPNMLARNLRTAESKSILIMVTNISNYFYMETVHGISDYAYEHGYDILLSETNEDTKKQYDCLLKIKNRIADGAIIIESTVNNELLLNMEKEYPVVQCSVYSDDVSVPYVAIDNVNGGYLGTRYLIDKGHRDIAFIGTLEKSKYNSDRIKGYKKALRESSIEINEERIIYTDLCFEGGKKIAHEMMELPNRPTALFFASDMPAIGALHELTTSGYVVPRDVAVLGFDNIELCNMVIPGLTTVGQPMYEIGRESARLLIQRIQKVTNDTAKNIVFQPKVVERGSV